MTAHLHRERLRGEQARSLLADPLLEEAFATIEANLRDTWAATADDAVAERERLWLMLKLLGRLRGHLTEIVETGRLAERQRAQGPT